MNSTTMQVYWINVQKIQSASPFTSTNITDVAAVPDQILSEVYLSVPSRQRIQDSYVDQYLVSIIRRPANWPNDRKLAFDWIRKQLYLVDSNAGTVQVVSTDGNQRCYLKSRLPQPKDIAVDPFNK